MRLKVEEMENTDIYNYTILTVFTGLALYKKTIHPPNPAHPG